MDATIQTKIPGFTLRFAEVEDITLLLDFIKRLADYEKKLDQVHITEDDLRQNMFTHRYAEAIISELHGQPVGYMVFFHNFSTFLGRPGIYLEDLFVLPELRGRGFGKAMFAYLASLARARKCSRLDWACLRWNAPSIRFYESLGALDQGEWLGYRLQDASLNALADSF